jgi:hypothetical protein
MTHTKPFDEFVKESKAKIDQDGHVNESYGQELDKLEKAFDKTAEAMRGSSALDPYGEIHIWVDLGVKKGFCDEMGRLKIKL